MSRTSMMLPTAEGGASLAGDLTPRERELGAIIDAYNRVTDQLKEAHDRLGQEVQRLHEELARKNRQLRRRERLAALGELAAGVAHEIRNPLGGIRVFASLLKRDVEDRPAAARTVERIIQGVNSLETIVTDILQFARPAGVVVGKVNVAGVAREVAALAEPRLASAQVSLRIDPQLAELVLISDAGLLQRALLNLVLNAIDAAGHQPGGMVEIDGRSGENDTVALQVADTGPGIPAELMDRIFNPFFTTKGQGTGLGLSIVHQIAETLGGSVQAANRREGGAVFTLRLPGTLAVTDEERDPGRV